MPMHLSSSDESRALEILGYGSASKILGNPYPLGGYSGVEIGVTSEFIPLDDLSHLGSKSDDNGELNFYDLTLAKGFYYNVDGLLYFTPPAQTQHIQNFGGQLRWGFYELTSFPISFSTVAYVGGANFDSLISVFSMGADLIATVSLDNVALYFGGGRSRAQGTFIGGSSGITASQQTERKTADEGHSVFGINVSVSQFFVALEIDRYTDSIYSGKLGMRF